LLYPAAEIERFDRELAEQARGDEDASTRRATA
jgi:hypothetical protein